MSHGPHGFDVLLYHDAVPVVRAKARFIGARRLMLILGPVAIPQNTRVEVQAASPCRAGLAGPSLHSPAPACRSICRPSTLFTTSNRQPAACFAPANEHLV